MFNHIPLNVHLPPLTATTTANGRVYCTPDGTNYPSITTILGHGEKPWLTAWIDMLGVDEAKRETDRCAERGTAVHDIIEKFLNNDNCPTAGHDVEHIKAFNQLKFKLKHINNIKSQEVALYSNALKIAGRVDIVGEYNGVLSIIDLKTSNSVKTIDMIQDYMLQATAYAIMWFERTGDPIDNVTILMSVEKSIVPLVFQDTIDKYIQPLIQRIETFHREHPDGRYNEQPGTKS